MPDRHGALGTVLQSFTGVNSSADIRSASVERIYNSVVMRTRPAVVAVFNSSDDMVELLRVLFERHGFVVVTGHISAIRKGELDLSSFVDQHKPDVVVYDVVPPYDRQWRFLDHLRQTSPLKTIPLVLTSSNAAATRELAGTDEQIIEVLGRPFEFDALVEAVKRANAS
jgi:CheY-like chemotaxis protein